MNRLIRFIFIQILFLSVTSLYSQSEMLNWIFFVNKKIPDVSMLSGEIIFQQDSSVHTIIPFDYSVGCIKISKENLHLIYNDTISDFYLRIVYSEYLRKTHNKYVYKIPIEKRFFTAPYIIFDIKNISKRKRKFFLEILGDGYKIRFTHNRLFFNNNKTLTEQSHHIRAKGVYNNLFIMTL